MELSTPSVCLCKPLVSVDHANTPKHKKKPLPGDPERGKGLLGLGWSSGCDPRSVRVPKDLDLKRYSVAPAYPLNLRASVVCVECVEVHIDPHLTRCLIAGVVGSPYRLRACSSSLANDDGEV